MDKKIIRVPFDMANKTMLNYTNYISDDKITWIDGTEFKDTMKYAGHYRGRSTMTIYLIGSNGIKYSMFYSEFEKALTSGAMNGILLTGTWGFRKQGANYSLTFIL